MTIKNLALGLKCAQLDSSKLYFGIYYQGVVRSKVFDTVTETQRYIHQNQMNGASVIEIRTAFRYPPNVVSRDLPLTGS